MERIAGYAVPYYWFGMLMIWLAKRFKYQEVGEKPKVRAAEFCWFFLLSITAGAGLSLERAWLNRLLFVLTATVFIALWLDALVMNQFSIQVNTHVLRIYLSNTAQMAGEAGWTLRNIAHKPLLVVFPFACVLFYFQFILGQQSRLWVALPFLGFYILAGLTYSKRLGFAASCAVVLGALLVALPAGTLPEGVFPLPGPAIWWIGIGTFGFLVALLVREGKGGPLGLLALAFVDRPASRQAFVKSPCAEFDPEFRDVVEIPLQNQRQSDWFGQCHNANIVLVTLESVAQRYVKSLSGRGAKMPVFEALASKGVSSRRHFCISPNTNNALAALYNGNYQHNFTFPHLKILHAQGYQSVALIPQDTSGFGFNRLLQEAGFQHIIDLKSLPEYNIQRDVETKHRVHFVDDAEFYEIAFSELSRLLRGKNKIFLHVMNSQTHFPYETHMQTPSPDVALRYVQSIEEADTCLGHFLLRLDELIPLQQTLMVYTADHGESLGERGYKAHSTAITREQINVPLAIHFPGMEHVEVPFSTHFDVFPTLFDLLGLEYPYQAIGGSMLGRKRELNAVLFSETRHGPTPSCYGHVSSDMKIFFDVTLNRYRLTDLDDQVIKELSGPELERYRAALWCALQKRGLVWR